MKITFLGSLLLCTCLSACVIDTSSRCEHTGRQVGPETLEQLQPGRTQEFALSLLGDPTTRSSAGGGTEVWKWEYTSREHHSGSLIFVIDSDKTTEVRRTTYALIEGGKIVKVWQD
jgi:outer membrane protein assembly factor BamE (lipoprotein component of BamABCDE complex)